MKRKVLIINDSKFEALVLLDLLTKLGYSGEIADEYNALKIIDKFKPNYIFVNYIMKETTGDKFIRSIKAKYKNINCYLSSCNQLELSNFKDSIDIDGVIQTPVTVKNLLNMIETKSKDILCRVCSKKIEPSFLHCPYCGEKV
ncbi:response regulator [Alkaliphilus peptidifermentans]|uniref:Stage 0 sporulation protein A homolog n=1 Tax=Alkaliphilus peptidifermentans DSM 18978 TaxID=1120976 RepID=A0A1G5K4X3_9FIRM|nr:response regulator [Alkaliphilus peptidifermentans]SCY95078.1 two-component system, chemotaxis family, response regulator CheY [Alkaliphilus peptidifermentans DSM 18978]